MKKRFILLIVISLVAGCASVPRFKPNAKHAAYLSEPKRVALIYPDISMYRLTAGGIAELMDEWKKEATAIILDEIIEKIRSYPRLELAGIIKEESLDEATRDFLREQKGIFNAVSKMAELAFMPYSPLAFKAKKFDYTMGPEVSRLSEIVPCDAYLFVTGSNHLWTPGRTALSVVSGLMSLAVSVATGVSGYIGPLPVDEWFTMALVEAQSGDIVWYYYKYRPGDLNADVVAKRHVRIFFKKLSNQWE